MKNLYRSDATEELVHAWCTHRLAAWAVPHEGHTVTTTVGDTHVVSAGSRPDVCVYLPGTNLNTATSTAVLGALAARATVYAADLPGQPGLSTGHRPSDERLGYAHWVTDLLRWVRERHPDGRLVLAGHSRGAAAALAAPTELVDRLLLVSPAGFAGVRATGPMLRATLPWLLRPRDASSRRLLAFMSGRSQPLTDDLVEWLTLVAQATRTTGAPGPLPADTLEGWRGRDVTVLVGERDHFFPVRRLSRAARRSVGVLPRVAPGAGHLLAEEHPELVAEAAITG